MNLRCVDFPKQMKHISPALMERVIVLALEEDLGTAGDITAQSVLGAVEEPKTARIISKESGVICGLEVLKTVYHKIDNRLTIELLKNEGDWVEKGDRIVQIEGRAIAITKGERTALNFLGMMSGVATKTRILSDLIKNYHTKLIDTRKTIPGLREFQKYAVYIGGGFNHRIGLYDMVLIKDNHIAAAGGITKAVALARSAHPEMVVEVETESLDQVEEALGTDADIIMLDNMDNSSIRKALNTIGTAKLTEVSGNVDEKRLVELAKIGVDFVSMGGLTHTIKPLDLSLLID